METNMGTSIRVFENANFGNIRIIVEDGKPLFCGKDVADALGYINSRKALADHCKGVTKRDTPTNGGIQPISYITEGDMYRLIAHSTLPSAEQFERWVFDEVLPSIRKHGAYLTDAAKEELFSDPETFARVVANWADERKARLAAEQKIEEQKPLVQFANHVASTDGLIDIGALAKLAKDANIIVGRNRLFAWLRNNNYLMRGNIPYQRYIEQGIFVLREGTFEASDGPRVYKKTYVTGKGQIYLIEKLRKAFCACA